VEQLLIKIPFTPFDLDEFEKRIVLEYVLERNNKVANIDPIIVADSLYYKGFIYRGA